MTDQKKRDHLWKPGQSGNPKGRPPLGNALTDAIRAKVDVHELVDIAVKLARAGVAESTRLGALCWLRDSGFTRPAEKHELAVGQLNDQEDDDLSQLSTEQLRDLAELEAKRAAILRLGHDTRGSAGESTAKTRACLPTVTSDDTSQPQRSPDSEDLP